MPKKKRPDLTEREERAVDAALAKALPALRDAITRELVALRAEERAGLPPPAGR